MKKKLNRRRFLKGSGLFAGSGLVSSTFLSNAIFQGVVQKAVAQVTGKQPINYAIINLNGAPPRWYFDNPLEAPTGTGLYNPYRSFGNAYKKIDGMMKADYKSTLFKNGENKNVYLPHLWAQKVPSSGGLRDLSDVLPNALFVRGIHNLIDGHEINNQMLVAPQLTEETTLGLNSDSSSRPFATVVSGYQATLAHKGRRNSNAAVRWSFQGKNTVTTLLTPFTDTSNMFNRRMTAGAEAQVDQALEAFHVYAEQNLKLKPSDVMAVQKVARANMKDFMLRSKELSDRWNATLTRYLKLVNEALRPTPTQMPGVGDQPIELFGRTSDLLNGSVVLMKDLRTSVQATTAANGLAELFALIEFLFVEGFSSTIALSAGTISNLLVDDVRLNPILLRDQLNAKRRDVVLTPMTKWQNNEIGYLDLMNQIKTIVNGQPDAAASTAATLTAKTADQTAAKAAHTSAVAAETAAKTASVADPDSTTKKKAWDDATAAVTAKKSALDAATAAVATAKKAADAAVAFNVVTASLKKIVADFKDGKPNGEIKSNPALSMSFDQHFYPSNISIYHTTLFYRALGASLAELIDKLKAADIFKKTLLHVAGDFNRMPRKDGSGSDHGFRGSNQSFYSGMITKGPFAIGNIVKQSDEGTYVGAWGVAAPIVVRPAVTGIPEVKRPLQPGDLGNSVCAVLGIPAVSTNGYSLFKLNDKGLIELIVKECKDV